MQRGDLVPDELMVEMIRERIARPDCSGGFMLDGFPRTVPQAEALEQMLRSEGKEIERLLYLHVDLEELVKRLTDRWTCPTCSRTYHPHSNPPRHDMKCNSDDTELVRRPDDNEETARRRAQVYYERTYPILDYYRPRGLVVEVDGHGSIQDVRDRIKNALADFASSRTA
jgi:adenylate kinase